MTNHDYQKIEWHEPRREESDAETIASFICMVGCVCVIFAILVLMTPGVWR